MQVEVGAVVEGTVTGITKFGAFVSLPDGKSGLVHISEIANTYVNDVNEFLKLGDKVMRLPETFTDSGEDKRSLRRPVVGRVVSIHPKGYYHTVEFELNGGHVRESFKGVSD